MNYISVFSGIGGLESQTTRPVLFCESDPICNKVLKHRYPECTVHDDICTLEPPHVDYVVGGWPCQDLTSAGKLGGIEAERSGLFFKMVSVATAADAHTIVGENVPNLLVMREGFDFDIVLNTLKSAGYKYVGWRTLNAREFQLAQERKRVFIVASRNREIALSVHADLPHNPAAANLGPPPAAGFYWTAGARSLCFSHGFVPALKIGASDNKGRSPIAVLYGNTVRKLTTSECMALQGFDMSAFEGITASNVFRMAGNAVPLPVGQYVVDSVFNQTGFGERCTFSGFDRVTYSGLYDDGKIWSVQHDVAPLATNLSDFLDLTHQASLSVQAATGLICRIIRANKRVPLELYDALYELSLKAPGKLVGSRSNSFETIRSLDPIGFRRSLIEGEIPEDVAQEAEMREEDIEMREEDENSESGEALSGFIG